MFSCVTEWEAGQWQDRKAGGSWNFRGAFGSRFCPRSAFKLVNTVLLLAGGEQHPAALDAGCIDLYTGALEVFKLGAAPTFVMGEEGIQVLKAGQVPAGALGQAEPVLLSQKLWAGTGLLW